MAVTFTNEDFDFVAAGVRVNDVLTLTAGEFIQVAEGDPALVYDHILITAVDVDNITIQTYDAAGDPVTLGAANVPADTYEFDITHICNKMEIVDVIMNSVKDQADYEHANTQTDPYTHYIRRALIDTPVSMALTLPVTSTTYVKE